ncbi:mucin-2-like isoform X2 [Mytilus trossulus]|uniref:mucin-2-like isoform X2 n=1 Tax=Mytilus trossulus TaxID=6551 RepID=UPI003006BC68
MDLIYLYSRGDSTVFYPSLGTLKYYMCMKITRVSDDVLYYYLLADKNGVANNERIYTANRAPDVSSTPTCDYCQFTQTIPDADRRELRKLGTSETLTATPSLCLPCEATCDETTIVNASALGPSSSLAVVTTMNPSTIQLTQETSNPIISQHFTTDIITTTTLTPASLKQTTNGAESACTFPSYLIGQWTDTTKGVNITFQSTTAKLTGWTAKVTGETFDGQTCIHNTGDVFVFEGDDTYHIPFSDKLKYFMCMKITKISDDVLYYYLLADKNSDANNERIYTPNPAPDDSTTPTCNYCQFTSPIPDIDFRELRKLGTIETITSTPVLCLPCESKCEETTSSSPTTIVPSSAAITTTEEATTKHSSLLQTTTEPSSSEKALSRTTDIITQYTTGETPSRDIQQTTTDLSKLQISTTEDRTTETSTTIKTTQTASVTEVKTSQTTSKLTTNIVISDTTTTDIISTTTTSHILTTPSKVVVASKDISTSTDESILTTQQEKPTTTAKSSGTGSIVDNNTEGLSESSILLITASSISGVLLGLAIITLGLCLIRHKSKIAKGRSAQQQHHHHHHRDRTRDYFNPL